MTYRDYRRAKIPFDIIRETDKVAQTSLESSSETTYTAADSNGESALNEFTRPSSTSIDPRASRG